MKKGNQLIVKVSAAVVLSSVVTPNAWAWDDELGCKGLPSWSKVRDALKGAVAQQNGGFGLNMWATIVDRDGIVCAVAFTGTNRGDQWPGSRVISGQKANTANSFSLPKLALSTANLFSAVKPGGSLFGLQFSNPVDTFNAYRLPSEKYGKVDDPLVGRKVGGVNVFGGGLALYNRSGTLLGGIGVSGDSSCADHNIAWRTRNTLKLDYVPAGVSGDAKRPDNIVYDISYDSNVGAGVPTAVPGGFFPAGGNSAGGWGHPNCQGPKSSVLPDIAKNLPAIGT